jgi:hypothetical protein
LGHDAERPGHITTHEVTPITAGGNMNGRSNPWGIKTPDGKYEYAGTSYGDDEAGLLVDMKAEYEEQEQARRG